MYGFGRMSVSASVAPVFDRCKLMTKWLARLIGLHPYASIPKSRLNYGYDDVRLLSCYILLHKNEVGHFDL